MHMAMKELRELAGCCLQGEMLSPAQVQKKRHMGECDSCYKRFCTEYLILLAFQQIGLYPFQESRAAVSMMSLLTIRLIENHLTVSCAQKIVDGCSWEFIHMPCIASARGGEKPLDSDCYVNLISEHSYIKREDGSVRIQLDGDVFPVEQLKVCVTTGQVKELYEFEYDPALECYKVVLDEAGLSEQSVIEIVEVSYC